VAAALAVATMQDGREIVDLTRFLGANRFPLRLKKLG
jgi:hypothetical protein